MRLLLPKAPNRKALTDCQYRLREGPFTNSLRLREGLSLIFNDEFHPPPVLQFAALADDLAKTSFLDHQTGPGGEALNWEITNYEQR